MYPPFAEPRRREAATSGEQSTLPSIQDFLDDLPPIEDYLDAGFAAASAEAFVKEDLPSIESYVEEEESDAEDQRHLEDEAEHLEAGRGEHSSDWFEQADFDAEGWAATGWQSFDWTRAASLGPRSEQRAEPVSGWDGLDWGTAPGEQERKAAGQRHDVPPSADEVARALDGIARRIRSGELVIDQHSGTPPEAALAAALAALLRKRD